MKFSKIIWLFHQHFVDKNSDKMKSKGPGKTRKIPLYANLLSKQLTSVINHTQHVNSWPYKLSLTYMIHGHIISFQMHFEWNSWVYICPCVFCVWPWDYYIHCRVGLPKPKNLRFFLLIWHTCQWAYIIMIHDSIIIWDHAFDFGGVCVICVCSSWLEYWLQKLHILQVYHIIPRLMHMKYLVNNTCTFSLAAILLKFLKWLSCLYY